MATRDAEVASRAEREPHRLLGRMAGPALLIGGEADAWGSRPLPIPALDLDAPLVDPPGRRSDLACRGVAHAAHPAR